MALSAAQQNLITEAGSIAKELLVYQSRIAQLDALWNGTPNWDDAVTQPLIDEIPSFLGAGLVKQNIADCIYSLKTAMDALTGNLPSMAVMTHLP